jgi:hypothetical protein
MAVYSGSVNNKEFPKRTKGYLLKVTIPEELAGKTKSIELLL